jgi:hypothetical protein
MSPDVSEADFQRAVIELAKLRGWRVWHDNDSRRNAAGFPDLIMVRRGRLVLAELKAQRGRLRPEQDGWLRDLAIVEAEAEGTGAVAERLWRPSDWSEIQAVLR